VPQNLALMRLIDEQYTRTPFYGIRRMTAWFEGLGLPGQPQAGGALDAADGDRGDLALAAASAKAEPSIGFILTCCAG
jgi:hypothetical protein